MEFEKILNTCRIKQKLINISKKYKNKKIVLYGAGLFADFLFERCDFSNLNIVAIADKKYEQEKSLMYNGIKTISPKELTTIDCDLILITNQDYKKFIEIIDNLLINTQNEKINIIALTQPSKKELLLKFLKKNKKTQITVKGFNDGHFYSPVPSESDKDLYKKKKWSDLKDINLNLKNQEELLNIYAELYKKFCFPFKEDRKISKYYLDAPFYNNNDGLSLNLFIRHFQPKNIIEVGSGYSTLCMTETCKISNIQSRITCIEPYPDRLKRLVDVNKDIKLYTKNLQNINYKILTEKLNEGDFLFIDSSHVYKYGSDVMYIFKKILPNLKAGVYVHFHDIPYPFEYHNVWVDNCWYWNEAFFLEQFLSNNENWEIVFWPSMLMEVSPKKIKKHLPIVKKMNFGGSIYLRKIK